MAEISHDFRLPIECNGPIARKCRQNAFVTEVSAPDLEVFRRKLEFISKLHQRVTKAVWIGIGKLNGCKCIPEDLSDRRCIAPVATREADGVETAGFVQADFCRRKQGVVIAPELVLS